MSTVTVRRRLFAPITTAAGPAPAQCNFVEFISCADTLSGTSHQLHFRIGARAWLLALDTTDAFDDLRSLHWQALDGRIQAAALATALSPVLCWLAARVDASVADIRIETGAAGIKPTAPSAAPVAGPAEAVHCDTLCLLVRALNEPSVFSQLRLTQLEGPRMTRSLVASWQLPDTMPGSCTDEPEPAASARPQLSAQPRALTRSELGSLSEGDVVLIESLEWLDALRCLRFMPTGTSQEWQLLKRQPDSASTDLAAEPLTDCAVISRASQPADGLSLDFSAALPAGLAAATTDGIRFSLFGGDRFRSEPPLESIDVRIQIFEPHLPPSTSPPASPPASLPAPLPASLSAPVDPPPVEAAGRRSTRPERRPVRVGRGRMVWIWGQPGIRLLELDHV